MKGDKERERTQREEGCEYRYHENGVTRERERERVKDM
jgi:hypothetical protein